LLSLHPTAADPRKDEFYGALLERAVRGLVEALGKESLRAVLLIGAPARGEATIVDTPDGLYSLSDIDLVCVSSTSADVPDLLARLAAWRAGVSEELGPRVKGVDVSVRTAADLASLPALITTYEMLSAPTVLWGDPDVLGSLPPRSIEEIPLADALTLFHNRMVEAVLLERHVRSPEPALLTALTILYGTAKLALDAVTAVLYLERNVPPRYGERVDVFRNVVLAENPAFRGRLADYVDDIALWARFKADGELDALAEQLGGSPQNLAALARETWRRYARYGEVFWREILERLTGADAGGAGLAETAALYAGLESMPKTIGRTWRLSRPGAAPDGLFSRGALLRGALFASPRQRAYLTAVVLYLGLAGAADSRTADELIRRYSPFRARTGHPSIATNEGREQLLDSLALYHEALLLGRRPGRS
jgi:predicted nucleotidyltransferase